MENHKGDIVWQFEQSRRKIFTTSTVVQWHSLEFPAITDVAQVRVYALLPLVYNAEWKAVASGPAERKLIHASSGVAMGMKKNEKVVASDNLLTLYAVSDVMSIG